MKRFKIWKDLFIVLSLLGLAGSLYFLIQKEWLFGASLGISSIVLFFLFMAFWHALSRKGIQTNVEISRVLGKDAKDALTFGEIGIITYNEEYVATWISDYLRHMHVDIVNKKLTSFFDDIRDLFDDDVDTVVGEYHGNIFEVKHKEGAQVLFVKNITHITMLQRRLQHGSLVIGQLNLDGYDQYQNSEDEEMLNKINRLRSQLFAWAKSNAILMRRIRSDRYFIIMESETLRTIRSHNFSILQIIKDTAESLEMSVTLSMALVENMSNLLEVDRALTEVMEIVQSRGGDQVGIKNGSLPIEFIGGNSEKALQPSKVRVRIVNSTIRDLVRNGGRVFILGHVNTDFDAMGAALGMSNWAKALNREAYIVLKDVPRDHQLQETLDVYNQALTSRHTMITENRALEMYDPEKDLIVMVDHSNPMISSGKHLLDLKGKVIIIDHHRRSEQYPDNVMVSYIESKASSTSEMVTELMQVSPISVPVFEFEATIMYLGILVDTGRFKSHTSERTFQAAGTLRAWGANPISAEQALKETYSEYRNRNALMEQAEVYHDKYFIDVLSTPVSRTLLSQISDGLLKFKGCEASFTIGINAENGRTAISARSNGTINVQRIMEQMHGGGHFSAAALERGDITPQEAAQTLKEILDTLQEEPLPLTEE